jgi:ATP-dependent RNA helicase DDX3X
MFIELEELAELEIQVFSSFLSHLFRFSYSGLATSFYNSAHSNIARELKELLMESNQKVPDFIEADSEYATGSTFRHGSRPSAPKVSMEREKPADWDCPHCGSSNFASRTVCFKRTCNSPKPVGGNARVTDNRQRNNNNDGGGDWGGGGGGGGGGSGWGGGGGGGSGWGGGDSKPANDDTSGWGGSGW